MATTVQVREGLMHVGQQLAAGTAMSAEVMGNVLTQLVAFTDIVTGLESNHQVLTTQVASEVGGIKEKIAQQQGALEVMAKRGGNADREYRPKGILG